MYDAFTRHSSNLQKHCINAISIWRYFEISVFGETNNVCRLQSDGSYQKQLCRALEDASALDLCACFLYLL